MARPFCSTFLGPAGPSLIEALFLLIGLTSPPHFWDQLVPASLKHTGPGTAPNWLKRFLGPAGPSLIEALVRILHCLAELAAFLGPAGPSLIEAVTSPPT